MQHLREHPVILITDDEEGIRSSFRFFLEDHDYEVEEAATGEEALDVLASREVDLVILDLRMPGMGGLQTLEKIKKLYFEIPVIIISGTGDMQDVVQALNLNAWGYLIKPVDDLNLLLHSVRKALEHLRMIREKAARQETLEMEVAQRTRELARAKEKAENANQAKTRFLTNVSHELRTPMNSIMGLLQLMYETTDDKTQRQYIEEALYSSRNLLTVVNDILDLASIESGQSTMREDTFDLSEVMRTVDGNFRFQAQSRNVKIKYELDPQLPSRVMGDMVRFRQILFNIVGNAVKFTEKGTITIQAHVLSSNTTDNQGRRLARILFTVSDTGRGIPEDRIDGIFEAFQRPPDRNERIQGSGLGLNIVRSLVHFMGGGITVESEPDKGTTFYIQIPFVLPHEEVPQKVSPPAEKETKCSSLPPAKVLLVEDDRINQLFTHKLLTLFGLQVLLAKTGKEALDILEKEDVDCVLMDIQMPEMNGLEATKTIRSWKKNTSPLSRKARAAKLPIAAITAHAMRGDREAFLQAGFDRYMSKPLEKEPLRRMLVELLGSSEPGKKQKPDATDTHP